MSYLVLARKYRPRVFSDMVGQDVVTATLRGAIAEGRVGHAYLFSGPRGTGKTTTSWPTMSEKTRGRYLRARTR